MSNWCTASSACGPTSTAQPATTFRCSGWAPITQDQAAEAQTTLVSQGWIREESPDGVYITEPKETTIAVDDEGYGMTYLFSADWVKLADTKQGLILIEWPKS
jgi:hypothetical protein